MCIRDSRISHSKTITSVAICPNEKIVAVGDTTGRITCYYGLTIRKDGGFVPHKNLRKTGSGEIREDFPHNTLHWHSTAIVALKFTLDGVSLLSCASEEVFVVWSISEGRKSFLPRIGTSISTIIRLNTDVSQFVLCGVDNSAYLLSLPNLSLEEILRGITNDTYNRSCRSVRSINAMYAIPFQQENLLVVNTGSVIQVFDYKADKHITCLEITGEVFKGADDSPAAAARFMDMYIDSNRLNQRSMRNEFDFFDDKNYGANDTFGAERREKGLDKSISQSRDRSDQMKKSLYGGVNPFGADFKLPEAPDPVKSNAEDIYEKALKKIK